MKPKPETKAGLVVTVGRHSDNSVVLEDHTIADRHAQIVIQDDFYFLRDLGSGRGTWVNGKPVKMAQLKHGDVVSFGSQSCSFTFSMEDENSPFGHSSLPEPDEKIDLSQAPRAKKIAWQKPGDSVPTNILPFPSRDTKPESRKNDDKTEGSIPKKQSPANDPVQVNIPDTAVEYSGRFIPAVRHMVIALASATVLVAVLFYHSWALRKHAYEAGYEYGMVEFINPPRNLDPAMIKKFAVPAAFKMEIKDANYDDFARGMTDACIKTYLLRFQRMPKFGG